MNKTALKGVPIELEGQFPEKGATVPDFVLVDKTLKDCSLADFQGKRKLLSIVPSLDTKVCLLSSKKFNDAAKQDTNLMVLVIASDLPFAMERICGFENLDNIKTLSMMRDKSFGRDYGVLMKNGPLAGITARAVIVLDEGNKVLYSELVEDLANEPKYEEALNALKS
ncbi:lipid hydroperoxide peroxidase [Candidatus Aerophobetes bacterium]|uniref:Thiol peroxidase n=1 Tax=Aerophobetes bacterium TaxID=2030807 RepID=A0A2A4Y9E4_UNCAE|nr:MAG: lipid hydroperoxide peroxidase [Candidatus Aerophobetes bacterium]